MKTIAQQINWDFEADGDLVIRDKNDNLIYLEDSGGGWIKFERDSQGKEIYYEDSNKFWVKSEYDSNGRTIYCETSKGTIIDNRPKSCENREIVIEGIKYKLVKQ